MLISTATYDINDDGNIRVGLLVRVKKMGVLGISNNGIHLGEVEDVGDVLRLKTDVDRHHNTASCYDTVDGLEESRSVGSQKTNALIATLAKVVGETTSTIGKLNV